MSIRLSIDAADYALECLAYAQQAMNDRGSTGAETDKQGNSKRRNDFDILKKFRSYYLESVVNKQFLYSNKHHSERNQIYVDIVPNFAYNNGKEWYER